MADEYGREDVACAVEQAGYLVILQMEVAVVIVVIACHGILTVYLAACDLFVGRAGAITCAEVQAVGAPSVLIPYPYAAQDHQTYNAKTFVEGKAGILIADDQAVEKLPGIVKELFADKKRMQEMRKNARELAIYDAAARICDEVKALAR